MTPPTNYQGYFLNLDRSVKRRIVMESQLQMLGLSDSFTRFVAIEGSEELLAQRSHKLSAAEMGCLLSHKGAAERGQIENLRPTIVIEDDVILSRSFDLVVQFLVRQCITKKYDIIFFETALPIDLAVLADLSRRYRRLVPQDRPNGRVTSFEVINLQGRMQGGFIAYLVPPASLDKLIKLYREHEYVGIAQPIDIIVRDAVNSGRLRAGVVFPFLATVAMENILESTIPRANRDPQSNVLAILLRQAFYFDLNVGTLLETVGAFLDPGFGTANIKNRQQLLGGLLGAYVNFDFKSF